MLKYDVDDIGCPIIRDGDCWLEIGGEELETTLYHKCKNREGTIVANSEGCNDIFLEWEVRERRCNQCDSWPVSDELWSLYVLLDGRGVNNAVE